MSLLNTNRLWLAWIFACAIGELLGIGAAAGVALLHLTLFGEPQNISQHIILLVIMVLAGCLEGLITGYFQWSVLRVKFPDMRSRNWIFATVGGAATAWFLGMLPSIYFSLQPISQGSAIEITNVQFAALSLISGIVLGAVFGVFQFLELRRHARDAWQWITANSLAWMMGMMVIYTGASMPSESTPLLLILLISTLSGLFAGLSVGMVTGWYLVRLEEK